MTRLQLIKSRMAVTPILAALTLFIILYSTSIMKIESIEAWLILGMVFVGVVSWKRMWCALCVADKNCRIQLQNGSYSNTRNPLYFFSFTGLIAVGLSTESLLLPLLLAFGFFLYYPSVVDMKEFENKKS